MGGNRVDVTWPTKCLPGNGIVGVQTSGTLGAIAKTQHIWTNQGVTLLPPPVGGIAELPDVDAAPLEADGTAGTRLGLLAGVTAAIVASAVALAGAAWYARRRLMGR